MIGSSVLRGLCLLAAGALLLACSDDATLLAEHLESAEAYVAEQDWEAARLELASAMRLDPQSADINLRLARVETARAHPSEALFYFEEAYRLDPDSVGAAVGIVGLVSFSDTERAKAVIAGIRERQPSDPRVHLATANLALVEEDIEAALAAALMAVELDPGFAKAHLQVGLVHVADIRQRNLQKREIREEMFSQAVAALQRARELAADETTASLRLRAWTEEANVYARRPRTLGKLRTTLAEAFDDPLLAAEEGLRRELVNSALKLGRRLRDPQLIQWSLEAAVEVYPQDYMAWGDLARNAQSKDGTGLQVLERMLERRPEDPRAHAIYARMLSQTGATGQAVAHLENVAAELEGDLSPVLQRLLELQLQQGNLDGARATQTEMAARYPETGATYHASAQLASAEGDLASSIDWLTRWLERNENLIALRMLGVAELTRGNPTAALSAADRALELAGERGARRRPALCLRGMALTRLGQHTSALQSLVQARNSRGANIEGCIEALGTALYATGRDENALTIIEPLLTKNPSREAVLLFARHESDRDPERARALLEGLLAAQPGDPGAHARLVQMDQRSGQPEAALARARAAATTFPDSPGISLLLGRTLHMAGQTEEAVEVLEATLERWPSAPGTATTLLSLLGQLGRLEEARETLEKLNAQGDLPSGSQVMLARMRTRAGDEAGAIELLESVLEAEPDLTAAANDLAYLLARTGDDLERATELAQRARGQNPESAQIADTLGWIFQRRGLSNAALVQFDEAIDLADPQSPAWATANYHRGLALRTLDRKDEAIDAVERALASGTDFPEAEDARGVIQELSSGAS